jgi:transposase-like protein
MSCTRCNSEVLTKGGTTQLGGQRFRCKHCGRRFTRRSSSAFSRRAFSDDIIALAVRWYVRYRLSYPEVSEWLAERGILVDQSTVYRWVQRFLPLFGGAVRKYRQPVGSDWRVDETYALLASAAVGTTSIAPLMAVGRLSTPMSLQLATWWRRVHSSSAPSLRLGSHRVASSPTRQLPIHQRLPWSCPA